MNPVSIHTFTDADIPALVALEQAYAGAFPGAPVFPGEMYFSPGFHGGADVFCACSDGRLLAYAPVYTQILEDGPAALPHQAWVEIKAQPELEEVEAVKDQLLERVIQCARAHISAFPGRPAVMTFEYRANETPAIEYVLSRGFAHGKSVFGMRRDLSQPIPVLPSPAGITIGCWKMEREAGQRAYTAARNECFPETPILLGDWQHFMQSPMWASGTTIAAFAGEELVGNVAVYWDEAENEQTGVKSGYTEYIFVRPAWQGRGIARAMIAEGMRYLQAHGMAAARLGVSALNENALGLYRGLGYEVVEESRFYSREI